MTAEQGPAAEAAASVDTDRVGAYMATEPRAVPDELLLKAMRPFENRLTVRQISQLRAALAVAADDLRAEARRECATELRALAQWDYARDRDAATEMHDLADSWEAR